MARVERKAKEIKALYRAIVKELGVDDDGNKWSCKNFKDDFSNLPIDVVGENGRKIHLSYDQWKDRLSISGDYPTTDAGQYCADCSNGQHNPSITVAAGRTPGAIAKGIRSRFMGDFNARWEQVAKIAAERNEYANKRSDMRDKLINMIEGASKSQHGDGMWAPSPYGELSPSGNDVHFGGHMYLPFDVAADVIAVIEAWRAKGGAE